MWLEERVRKLVPHRQTHPSPLLYRVSIVAAIRRTYIDTSPQATTINFSTAVLTAPITIMSARIHTILIIGGTAGIGEQFARRFHALGKKVIVTGRNQDKLSELAKELTGLETHRVSHESRHVSAILASESYQV